MLVEGKLKANGQHWENQSAECYMSVIIYIYMYVVHTSPLVLGDSLLTTSASRGLCDVLSILCSLRSLARLFLPGYLSL